MKSVPAREAWTLLQMHARALALSVEPELHQLGGAVLQETVRKIVGLPPRDDTIEVVDAAFADDGPHKEKRP